jgi:hypothetical protein
MSRLYYYATTLRTYRSNELYSNNRLVNKGRNPNQNKEYNSRGYSRGIPYILLYILKSTTIETNYIVIID